ncbi:NADPH:quinone oxidoreductase family protein [Aquihabitans daechungensis]|uniref:NADPH:quinone oxidoreductase family protein n=1 Tax=Aquihabitans daechungensis TaxID=1052257 RepID=UPI003BA3658E
MSDDPTGVTATMRAWRTHEYGPPLEALRLDTVPVPAPAAGQVLVRVQAIPLNLNDLERIQGGNMMVEPELPYSPGMEVFGVVEACGEGVAADEWIGRRVAAMPLQAHGGYAEYAVGNAVSAFEVPDSIPLPGAAALYFPFHLAWLGLVDRAHLQPGETVLIHAAAGGSGSAAIQLAKHLGARVIAAAGGPEKGERCRELGADLVLDSRVDDFAESGLADAVLAETGGRGVDVVFDNVGEALFDASLKATAYDGRYLMMGFASNKAVADEPWIVPRRVLLANIMIGGVTLAYADDGMRSLVKTAMGWNFASGEQGAAIMREIVGLVERGAVRPVVGQVVGFEDLPAAITAMAQRTTTGRTIALMEDGT